MGERWWPNWLAVDEAWAVSHVGGGRYDPGRLIGAGILILAAWLGGAALGVFAGGVLGDPRALGLDATFPALFAGLLWGSRRLTAWPLPSG